MDKRIKVSTALYDTDLSRYIPQFSVDCVILGFNAGMLKVLLCKLDFADRWMLPGGFVFQDENVDDAAVNILESRTSINNIYLKQFHLFGNKDRVDKERVDQILEIVKPRDPDNHWLRHRFLSVGYYALVEYDRVKIRADENEQVGWFCLNELPQLYIDHKEIIEVAIRSIRNDVGYIPIGYELLPHKFTMPELRAIYETIFGRELDRRNFQRKMLSTGLIKALNETRRDGAHKSPNLYSFNKEKYQEALKNGIQLMHIIF